MRGDNFPGVHSARIRGEASLLLEADFRGRVQLWRCRPPLLRGLGIQALRKEGRQESHHHMDVFAGTFGTASKLGATLEGTA